MGSGKLKRAYDKVDSMRTQLAICNKAYIDLFDKYNKLYQKYSYEETMEKVKEVNELRKDRKNIT